MSSPNSRREDADPASQASLPPAGTGRAGLRATHYRYFAEAASVANLSLAGPKPLERGWPEGSFFVRVGDDSTLTLCALRLPNGLPWRVVFRRPRPVWLDLQLTGSHHVLRVGGRAQRTDVPRGGRVGSDYDALRIEVASAQFLRKSERERPPAESTD